MSGGSSVTFADAGIFAVAFRFGYTAALDFSTVDCNRGAKMQRQFYADFLCNGKFAYLPHFAQTGITGSNNRGTAAYSGARAGFGKGHNFYRHTDQIGLIEYIVAGGRNFAFSFVTAAFF